MIYVEDGKGSAYFIEESQQAAYAGRGFHPPAAAEKIETPDDPGKAKKGKSES